MIGPAGTFAAPKPLESESRLWVPGDDKLFKLAAKGDARLSKRAGYRMVDITQSLLSLIERGSVEVGYRQSCGKTDPTAYIYREWVKIMKAAQRSGLIITTTPVKHGNAYATSKGGFWTSAIYELETPGGLKGRQGKTQD